ncbi:cytochrome P450 2J6-like, partial [Python bivittatus]|uniref:Cytochrome P450 2J6-like n=1 Tax=Python bivittatus TaxID=176946 RepID=A0A9F2RCZ5_PYTBI
IIFSNGHVWKQQRHIGVGSLRKLGMGKKSIEHQIQEGSRLLVEVFARTKGQPFDPFIPLTNAVTNVICALTFGHQFALEDENFLKLIEAINYMVKFSASFFHLLYELFPGLMKKLPGSHKKTLYYSEFVISFAKQQMEKHKNYHALHEPQDFIDYYLFQIEKSKHDSNTTYNEENLAQCVHDLFLAGTETTSVTMMWILLILANHPNIQEKVCKEIEDVFGSSDSISYQERKKLPYTNAVIHEIQRLKYILLFGVPRQSIKDVKMEGFHIPKGTIIVPDLRSVLLDPEEWETPEKFNPNHFLDKDGNFKAQEAFLPFGKGSRVCLGEQLARIEIFIMLTSLLKTFSFQLPEGEKELNDKPIVAMSMHPHPFKLCAVPHQTSS